MNECQWRGSKCYEEGEKEHVSLKVEFWKAGEIYDGVNREMESLPSADSSFSLAGISNLRYVDNVYIQRDI